MTRAAVTRVVAGRLRRLALPLGGLEALAGHEPRLLVLHARLQHGVASGDLDYRDVRAVLNAASDPAEAGALIEDVGVIGASALALEVLTLALTDEPGDDAAPKKAPAPAIWSFVWGLILKRPARWA